MVYPLPGGSWSKRRCEMSERIRSAIIGSFVGDSMALATHFVRDQEAIKQKYGRIETLLKPELVEHHKNSDAGEFTHYGDQAYQLLIETSLKDSFDQMSFGTRFRCLFKGDYKGYVDQATQKTLDLISVCTSYAECVSRSSDLGGASRMAPLLLAYGDDLSELLDATERFVIYTHENLTVMETAAFFAEVTYRVLHEEISPAEVMKELLESKKYTQINEMIKAGLDSVDMDTSEAICYLGMSCDVDGALASTVHVVAKYENNFKEAIIENVMAGGDSAGRGMLIGMVLGAYLGMEAIPSEWVNGLKSLENINGYINHTKRLRYYDFDRVS